MAFLLDVTITYNDSAIKTNSVFTGVSVAPPATMTPPQYGTWLASVGYATGMTMPQPISIDDGTTSMTALRGNWNTTSFWFT